MSFQANEPLVNTDGTGIPGPPVQALAPSAPGEETREELRRRLEAQKVYARGMKEELERAQRKVYALESRVGELQTTLIAKEADAAAAVASAEAKVQDALARAAESDARSASASDRLKVAPLVDRAIRALTVETSALAAAAGIAPTMDAAKMAALPATPVLALVDQVRRTVRFTSSTLSQRPGGGNGLVGQSSGATSVGGARGAAFRGADSYQPPRSLGETLPPPAEALAGRSRDPSRDRADGPAAERIMELESEVQELRKEAVKLRQRETHVRERCERTADVARRDCAAAKQENRALARSLKDAQARLKKREEAEISATQLERARRETQETKKHMHVAVSAKQQEIQKLKRDHAEQLQGTLAEVEKLKRAQRKARSLETDLKSAMERERSAGEQLTRSGIQRQDAEIARLKALVDRQAQQSTETQAALRASESRVDGLRRDVAMSKKAYNDLFATHVADSRARTEAAETLRQEAIKDVIGEGAASIAALEEKKTQQAEEIARLRRKLRQVLVEVGHHELYELEAMSPDAADAALGLTRPTSAASAADYTAGELPPAVQSALDAPALAAADMHRRRASPRADGEQDPSPVLTVRPHEVKIDTVLPVYGSPSPYANPYDQSGAEPVTAAVARSSHGKHGADAGEVSIRPAQDVESNPRAEPTRLETKRHGASLSPGAARVENDVGVLLRGEPARGSRRAVIAAIAKKREVQSEGRDARRPRSALS